MKTTQTRNVGPPRILLATWLLLLTSSVVASPALAGWEEGVAAFGDGRWADAEQEFRSVIDRSPSSPAGHYMLGMTLYRQERAAEALASLERSVELGPGELTNRLTLAKVQLEVNHADDALRTLQTVDRPDVPARQLAAFDKVLGTAAGRAQDRQSAFTVLAAALADDEGSKPLWEAYGAVSQGGKKYEEAFRGYRRAYRQDPGDTRLASKAVRIAFVIAQNRRGTEDEAPWYRQATEVAREWARAVPSAEAFGMAGEALIGAKDLTGALDWFERQAAQVPEEAGPHLQLASCTLALADPEEALAHLDEAVRRSPSAEQRRKIQSLRGSAYHQLKQFDKAAAFYREAGETEKAAEMAKLAAAQQLNREIDEETARCRAKVAEIEQIKAENQDLIGTAAWEPFAKDFDAIVARCQPFLKDQG